MPQNTPRGTPGRVVVLFALLSAVVAGLTLQEHRQRARRYTISYPTGMADTRCFRPGNDLPTARFEGTTYQLKAGKHVTRRDDSVYAVPISLDQNVRLYTDEFLPPEGKVPRFFLKLAPQEYLRVMLHPKDVNAHAKSSPPPP
jgi:hypothetical protein